MIVNNHFETAPFSFLYFTFSQSAVADALLAMPFCSSDFFYIVLRLGLDL